MKLSELLQEQTEFLTDRDEIQKWFNTHLHENPVKNFRVMPNGTVDVEGDVLLDGRNSLSTETLKADATASIDIGEIPIKFGRIYGDFQMRSIRIKNIEFLPEICEGFFFYSPLVTSMDKMPICERVILAGLPITEFPVFHANDKLMFINLQQTQITSLVGVEDKIIGSMSRGGTIRLPYEKITEGGLGLLNVKGLEDLDNLDKMPEPFQIIERYIGRPDDIFDCQAELIEEGFEEFAKL